MSQSGSYSAGGGGGGGISTLTGNSGGAIGPTAGNVTIVGTGGVLVSGNPGTSTLTISAVVGNLTFATDGTPAMPAANTINIDGSANISTNGAGSTVTISLANSPNIAGNLTVGNNLFLTNYGAGVLVSSALGAITSSTGTNGQLLIGSTGVTPTWATLTPGTGISITNAAGSITLSVAGGGNTWTVITAATLNMAVNNGYIANRAGGVAFTLPAVSAVGDSLKVTGINAGGFTISQGAGQTIYFGIAQTTTGVAGMLTSNTNRDSLEMICVIANTSWNIINAVGNLVLA